MKGVAGWVRDGARVFVVGSALLFAALVTTGCDKGARGKVQVTYSVGDVVSVHDEVKVGQQVVRGRLRVADGQTIVTGPTGRARLSLDSGATVAVDASTELKLQDGKLTILAGRALVRTEKEALHVSWANAEAKIAASSVAFDLTGSGESRTYCANGEISVMAFGQQHRVQGGETATTKEGQMRVLPEKAFLDWTGGLAEPERSEIEGKSAIPLVRARENKSDPGTPLIVRSHLVDTKIVGEVAVTSSRTTYFNGSDRAGEARVRMALPEGAILTRLAVKSEQGPETQASVQISAGPARTPGYEAYGLEWAGGGWLQGTLARISAGQILELSLEYAEWLNIEGGKASYRYPVETESAAAPIGELALRVDAQETKTEALTVNRGTEVTGRKATFRAADVRPAGEFVMELTPSVVKDGEARAYVQRTGALAKDAYILVRTELPEKKASGVTLAVVVDTSLSVGAATLETSLAVVDTLLESLGPEDSLVLLAADEQARPVGPALPAPVNAELKKTLQKELAKLRPGGASNLSLALQAATDLLDAKSRGDQAGEGMVVYIGDGRPSVGEPDAHSIRTLLEGRPLGMPRLGAVAVGPAPDTWLLAQLVAGSGTVAVVSDRADSARAGAELLSEALTPRFRDVALDLGPHVDRIYPRRSRVVTAGSTVTVVGRVRGSVPTTVGLRYRDGARVVVEKRNLKRLTVPPSGALEKQWAAFRVAQITGEGEGIEPAIALAHEASLLTPWTGWLFGAPPVGAGTDPFASRVLELSPVQDAPFARHVDPVLGAGSSLLEPHEPALAGSSLVEAAQAAMRRIITGASRSIRACRDARAAVSPDVGDSFRIDVTVDASGVLTRVSVQAGDAHRQDRLLARCIEGVVKGMPFFGVGKGVSVSHDVTVLGRRNLQRTKCSDASQVSRPVRREIWRARAPSAASDYQAAGDSCELRNWADRQTFLLLLMSNVNGGVARLSLAQDLFVAGESDAADFVRNQTLRAAHGFDELQELMRILRADEPDIGGELEAALKKATSHEESLELCRKFLRIAPHSTYARRRLLSLLEALGRQEAVVSAVLEWRAEPVADAGLLAEGASALIRLKMVDEGRRAFGELIERAPRDPWTLAFVGDRLRAEGLFDEAGAAYASLARILPQEAGVTLRQALAHAGAGRIDVATRMLELVAQTGGRHDDGRLADLAMITEAVILSSVRANAEKDVRAEIERRLLRTPLPDAQALVLVQAAPSAEPVQFELLREKGETIGQSAAMDARDLGLVAARVERGETGKIKLSLRRQTIAGPSHPVEALVSILLLGEPGVLPEIQTKKVQVSADGEPMELTFFEGRLL